MFFGFATVLPWGRWWAVLSGLLVTAAFTAMAIRVPFTRVVATGDGITIHAIARTAFHPRNTITLIGVVASDTEGGLISVYTPRLSLTDGRTVQLIPAGGYRRAMAATIGASRRGASKPVADERSRKGLGFPSPRPAGRGALARPAGMRHTTQSDGLGYNNSAAVIPSRRSGWFSLLDLVHTASGSL